MSYALAGLANPPIRAGELAATDPIMNQSTLFAAGMLKQMVKQPASRRVAWLRGELNKAQPGMGTEVVAKINTLTARGVPRNQAIFDAIRLAAANRVATWISRGGASKLRSLSGLGESVGDINAVMCGIMGVATAGGAIITSAMENPAGSAAVGQAGAGAMVANSCNAGALAEQARIAEAQARIAEAGAAAGASTETSNTVLYVAIGGGALLLIFGGILLLKMK